MTDAIGAHFFHRWRGWWGTPAAFNQAYIGSGPLPVPHAAPVRQPAAPMIADAARTTVAGATAPAATKAVPMSLATTQPAYADSVAWSGTLRAPGQQTDKIGIASCRERVCSYVLIWVVAESLIQNKNIKETTQN